MLRRTIIITIIVILVAIAVTSLIILAVRDRSSGTASSSSDGVVSLFPTAGDKELPTDIRLASIGSTTTNTSEPVVLNLLGLKQVTPDPVSGATFGKIDNSTSVVYMEKGSGHIFIMPPEALAPLRISNTTLPRVQEVVWGGDSNAIRLISSSFKDAPEQMTHLLSIASSTTRDSGELLSGLLTNFSRVTAAPDKKNVAFITESSSGAVVQIADFELRKPKQIFSHPLRQWEIAWPHPAHVTLQTRPAASLAGNFLSINPTTGVVTTLLSGVPGLQAKLNPTATHILYSESNLATMKLNLRSIKTASTTSLGLAGLADKCVWSTKTGDAYCAVPNNPAPGEYPGDWYRGETFFADTLWLIKPDGTTTRLYNFAENSSGYLIDATDLQLDIDNTFLMFTNKRDGSLWLLDLSVF